MQLKSKEEEKQTTTKESTNKISSWETRLSKGGTKKRGNVLGKERD